ncbi:hypothetical protein PFISCL1PPCAC_12905 [Pristionchus fissidentatus]|uniref:G protein-coupled receptor n=1 Tax=Pristionchus fissidentatus TaxID=1538716 RepID=A0AAV5VTC3_9BILA|nr:hypothetical protein PFISCL1PPCAC_12905 [Pristionchus fissidentatus]
MPIMAHLFIYRLIVLKWFLNCWYNYHSDDELQAYVKPFLESDFPGEGEGHIGALYYNEQGLRFSAVLTTMGFNSIMCFWSVVIFTCSVQIVLFFSVKTSCHLYSVKRLSTLLFLRLQ